MFHRMVRSYNGNNVPGRNEETINLVMTIYYFLHLLKDSFHRPKFLPVGLKQGWACCVAPRILAPSWALDVT